MRNILYCCRRDITHHPQQFLPQKSNWMDPQPSYIVIMIDLCKLWLILQHLCAYYCCLAFLKWSHTLEFDFQISVQQLRDARTYLKKSIQFVSNQVGCFNACNHWPTLHSIIYLGWILYLPLLKESLYIKGVAVFITEWQTS